MQEPEWEYPTRCLCGNDLWWIKVMLHLLNTNSTQLFSSLSLAPSWSRTLPFLVWKIARAACFASQFPPLPWSLFATRDQNGLLKTFQSIPVPCNLLLSSISHSEPNQGPCGILASLVSPFSSSSKPGTSPCQDPWHYLSSPSGASLSLRATQNSTACHRVFDEISFWVGLLQCST